MSKKSKIVFAVLLILLAAASRLVKHPFNFTPIIAMSLFAGCYLKKYWAALLPLAAMIVSDYFIGFYDWQVMASVYLGIALAFFIGRILANYKKWYNVIAASLISSLSFFIITNFAVWAFFNWYPHSWQGLLNCFVLAVPFFRNSLAGDLIYTGALFGFYELAIWFVARRAIVPATKYE